MYMLWLVLTSMFVVLLLCYHVCLFLFHGLYIYMYVLPILHYGNSESEMLLRPRKFQKRGRSE